MKIEMLSAAVAVMAAGTLAAVTVGPDWCVAYPESGSKDVNRVLRIVADEVREDINEATGLNIKVLPASKAKSPAIYIGAEFAEKAGFDLSGLKWYDNVIAEKGGDIYLFGNDRPGRDPGKYGKRINWYCCVLPSVKAATRFLETAAGVRFLMPGDVGKEIPKRKEVKVADGAFSKECPMQIYGSGRSEMNRAFIYLIANGVFNMGAFHSYGGHTYGHACPSSKYFKDHPEYFGMVNGKRVPGPTVGQTVLCISNPEVEKLIIAELNRQFDMGAEVCQLGQQDGWKFCECDKCRNLYGVGDDRGEKFWIFHRHIAERMLKERPGKIVNILCYDMTKHPPKTFKTFPSNVMVELCHYTEEDFRAWKGYTVPHGFTVYSYLTGNYLQPGFVAKHSLAYLAMLAKRFRTNNVRGLYRCGSAGSAGDLYGTEGPGYYVFNKLLLDGSLNVVSLLEDYCMAAFGPAAGQMRKFYEIQDARLRMYDRILEPFPSDSADGIAGLVKASPKNALDLHGYMFSPATISDMEACLSRAENTEGLSAKHKKRLELVRLEFDYAKMMGKISTLYSAFNVCPVKPVFDSLADVVEQRNAYIERLFGGNERAQKIDGWPEVIPFGWGCTRKVMKQNGRLFAVIGAPLNWNVGVLRKSMVLPGTSVKTVEARRAAASPVFGEFSSSVGWSDLGGMSMENVETRAKFKAMYDSANLYLLVESDLPDKAEVKAFPRDGGCWDDECVDVLLSPQMDRDVFYHLIWNVDPESRYDDVTGLVKSPLDPGYGKADRTWNGKRWRTENRREGGKWRSIAVIPYSDLGITAPKKGDSWFINVGRIARSRKNIKDLEYLLWSPNMESRSFVAPNAMGTMIFK